MQFSSFNKHCGLYIVWKQPKDPTNSKGLLPIFGNNPKGIISCTCDSYFFPLHIWFNISMVSHHIPLEWAMKGSSTKRFSKWFKNNFQIIFELILWWLLATFSEKIVTKHFFRKKPLKFTPEWIQKIFKSIRKSRDILN